MHRQVTVVRFCREKNYPFLLNKNIKTSMSMWGIILLSRSNGSLLLCRPILKLLVCPNIEYEHILSSQKNRESSNVNTSSTLRDGKYPLPCPVLGLHNFPCPFLSIHSPAIPSFHCLLHIRPNASLGYYSGIFVEKNVSGIEFICCMKLVKVNNKYWSLVVMN